MPDLIFQPFPVLITNRLTLRQLDESDVNVIFSIRSNPSINEFIDRPETKTLAEAEQFITTINKRIENNESIYWGIILNEENKFVGTICLWNLDQENSKAEIGYELLPEFQGRGIMQEALTKVLEYGFTKMKLEGIEAETHVSNIKSSLLLEKNFFRREQKSIARNESANAYFIFTLTKSDWITKNLVHKK